MSYRNPRVVIDNRLGEAFIQNTKDFGESLTTSAISVGKQVQARREINAKIVNDINNYQSKVDDNLVKVAIENKTDVNSFINGTKDMAKLFKQAKFRKLKNQGSYEGMDEDEDLIRSYSTYVQSAGSYMAAMSSASEEYSTTLDSKGMGKAPGQISSDSDSRWIIANNLARSGNNSSGKIEYKTVYGGPASGVQLMMVVSGESIKKANEELAEKTGDSSYLESGDTYTLSANDLASRNTGSNASPFSKGPYSINPDMIGSGEEGSTGVLKDFIANKVIGKNRNLTDEYMSQPETVIRSVIIDGQTKKYYVDGKTPNTKKIEEDIKSSTNSYINSTARLGGNAMNNLLNGIAKSRKTASGEVELYYNPALRDEDGQPQRDESGKVLFGLEVILSDDGTLETDYNDETSGTFGYTPEVMNKLKDFALHFAVENVGGFNDPTETENTKKQFIKEEKPEKPDTPRTLTSGERRDVSTTNLIDTNLLKISTKIKDGLLSEIDLSGLDGLKSGYQFISDPDDMGWVTAQGPKTAKGDAGEKVRLDFRTESATEESRQKLYNLLLSETKVVPQDEKQSENPDMEPLIQTISRMSDGIEDDEFIGLLEKQNYGGKTYKEFLGQYGIELDYSAFDGKDILDVTSGGKTYAVNLKDANWKKNLSNIFKKAVGNKTSGNVDAFGNPI